MSRDLASRFEAILAAVPDIIVEVDADKRIQWMNDAGYRFFGQAIGREASDFFEGEQDTYEQVAPLFAGDENVIYVESWQRRQDGEARLLAWWCRVLKDSVGNVVGALSTARDVTYQREIDARLAQSEEELRLTFDNAPIAIAVYGLDGRLVRVNQACCDVWGYAEEELMGKSFRELTHPDDVARSIECFERIASGEVRNQVIHKRFLRRDGEVFHSELHACLIPGTEDRPAEIVGQILDLTEQIKAEEEAALHRERLAHVARLSTMGELAAGIAHEINQPLAAITTYAEACQGLIADGKGESREVDQALREIGAQAMRAGEVLKRVRGFVTKHEPQREQVDINRLVGEVVRLADLDARQRHIRNRLELASGLPKVVVDTVQIQQVLLNLIRNGMEASEGPEAGPRAITIRTLAAGRDSIEVCVEDQGAGLPEHLEKEIFDPFFTTKATGMGMGLSISRSIIDAHGGRLWFTRNDREGTTFHFTLPAGNGVDRD
jgi:two-component system sensor kinase FixL